MYILFVFSEINSINWDGELQAENLLYDEKLLVIGCMSVMLGNKYLYNVLQPFDL